MQEQCFQLVGQLKQQLRCIVIVFVFLGVLMWKPVARLWTTEDTIFYSGTEDNIQKKHIENTTVFKLSKIYKLEYKCISTSFFLYVGK